MVRRQLTAGAAKNDIEASPAAMASVRVPNRGDIRRMARGFEPVMDRSPNPPSLDRRIAWPVMPGDQEQHAVAASDRLFETAIDCTPRGIEIHAMEVEHAIRLNRSAAKAFIPASVQGAFRRRPRMCHLPGARSRFCGAQNNRFWMIIRWLQIALYTR
jgi:hypothetical protein